MITTFLQRLLWLVLLVALQMLVCNHIHVMGYATPLLFVYFVTLFPLGSSRWSVLLWSFACGVLADITMMTPGAAAAAMTLAGLIQPSLLQAMQPKDAPEHMEAGFHTLGFWNYVYYCALLTLVVTLAFFLLQFFTFFQVVDMAITWGGSWALTFALCLLVENIRKRKQEE